MGIALVLFCLFGASVAGYALVKYESIGRVGDLEFDQVAEGDAKNILIVAPDTREGHSGRNTDTIMVVRVDPASDRLALTSFPRDLIVTVADTGELGMINSVYAREGDAGPANLIATLRQNFDIPIHHFVEVNFESFKQVVDAVGGIPVWMDSAVHDPHSGFYSEKLGCVTLDGEQALLFVRSRYLDVMIDGEWQDDPKSDEHRVLRQQVFVQRALSLLLSEVKSDPKRLPELIDIGVSNVRLDDNLGIGEIRDLAEQFKDFDADKLETLPMPVEPYAANENRLLLREAEAEPLLNVFRGLAPGEIRPGLVNVTVLNGTVADEAQVVEGLATDVSGALQQVGFQMQAASDAETFYEKTTIEHAPGQEAYAERVARHISSDAPVPLVENPDLQPTHVTLIAGADFTTVHEQATPLESMPGAAEAGAGDGAASAEGAEAAPADSSSESGSDEGGSAPAETPAETPPTTAPPTPPTTENPFIVGASPRNDRCV